MFPRTSTFNMKYLTRYQGTTSQISSDRVWFFGLACASVVTTTLGIFGINRLTERTTVEDIPTQEQFDSIGKLIVSELRTSEELLSQLRNDNEEFLSQLRNDNKKLLSEFNKK